MLVWFLPRATLSVTVQGTAAWHPFVFPVWPTKPSLCRWWQRASCAPVYCSTPRPAALSAAGIRPTAWQKRGARKTSLPPTVWGETGNHKQLRADESHRHLLVATLKDSRTKKLDTWKKTRSSTCFGPQSPLKLLSCWSAAAETDVVLYVKLLNQVIVVDPCIFSEPSPHPTTAEGINQDHITNSLFSNYCHWGLGTVPFTGCLWRKVSVWRET